MLNQEEEHENLSTDPGKSLRIFPGRPQHLASIVLGPFFEDSGKVCESRVSIKPLHSLTASWKQMFMTTIAGLVWQIISESHKSKG